MPPLARLSESQSVVAEVRLKSGRWRKTGSGGRVDGRMCVPFRCLMILLLAGFSTGRAGASEAAGLDGAKWIWYSSEPMPASIDFPGGVAFFRGGVELPADVRVTGAELALTADNLWLVHVNGQPVGASQMSPDSWNQVKRFDLTGLLRAGRNVIAVEAVNTVPGPAALLARIEVRTVDGGQVVRGTGDAWKCSNGEQDGWREPAFDDAAWQAAHVVGDYGMAPWGKVALPGNVEAAAAPAKEVLGRFRKQKTAAIRGGRGGAQAPLCREPRADETWPGALVFVGDDCSLYRPARHAGNSQDSLSVTIFNPNHGRAYPEHDLPAPVKMGRKLMVLRPARPGVEPQVLWDAGRGAVGPPAVSYDGRWVYFPMVEAGGAFFHLHRIPAEGGTPQRLTDGPFHDIDPCELPDGRIVFSSTRAGTFEEYHNPPSRSLFTLAADGRIEPFTYTFQFDNEPKMLADGRLLVLRTDNFFDRGKVETMLHAVWPDGSGGLTEIGLDQGPEYGNRLRAFNAGSAAPMADGRVAWVDGTSVRLARPGEPAATWRMIEVAAADVAALPDGRLVCTVATEGKAGPPGAWPFRGLAMLEPDATEPEVVMLHESTSGAIHSPAFLGPRERPQQLAGRARNANGNAEGKTGVLYCQNARNTRNHTAGWSQVRAIRVLAGYGLTMRSSHSYLVHAGSEVVELGTVPLADDGSFAIEVPADTAIALQAVDGEGRSELNQMSWMYVRPGETRGCVGCHQPREAAPLATGGFLKASTTAPLKLTAEGGSPRFRGNNAAVTGLMELQFDRFREVAGIGGGETGRMLEQAADADPGKAQDAARHLGLRREAGATTALVRLLGSADREARVSAAIALAACGTAAAVEPLLGSLADADPLVAQAAAVAVENLSGVAVAGFDGFAPLEDRQAWVIRWRAANPLPGDPRWLEQRIGELAGDDRDRSRRAAVALRHCGGQAASVALRDRFLAARAVNPFPAWRADHGHRGDGTRFNSLGAVNPRALQEITRAYAAVAGADAVALLAETVAANLNPETGNLFLAEAAAEGLGRCPAAQAGPALVGLLDKLPSYVTHCRWYGDHDALIACHAAPVHARVVEGLDRMEWKDVSAQVPALVRMVPTDPDRALLPGNDDFENLVGRVIRRSARWEPLLETCLRVLGDPVAPEPDAGLLAALDDVHAAWAGDPNREIRAAQILSLVARRPQDAPRVADAFRRYRGREVTIPRVYDRGIPVVTELPVKNWVCFYLARTLGQIGDRAGAEVLLESLADGLAEAAAGRPDPLGPGVHFLHNDLTPCWRAGAAWAVGRIRPEGASGVLRRVLANLENAPDTRHAAAVALGGVATRDELPALEQLAAEVPETAARKVLLETCQRLRERSP
jgi:HEAT repeat protein